MIMTSFKTIILLLTILLIIGCGESNSYPIKEAAPTFEARIVRTHYGVPHIYAKSLGSLSFGNAYAQAQDNICIMADNYVRVKGERARFFGPDKEKKGDALNLIQDFGYKSLAFVEQASEKWSQLSPDSQEIIDGFVAGYNTYLSHVKEGRYSLPKACRDQEWVVPVRREDVLAYLFSIAAFPGSERFMADYYAANPNNTGDQKQLASSQHDDHGYSIGSNAWALGHDKIEQGNGMLLANPHFPYEGDMRFWQAHHVVDGKIDVMGASLVGFPGVINIGFNRHIAWTHTYSSAEHVVVYKMQTADNNPLSYVIDGVVRPVKSKPVHIEFKSDNGIQTITKDHFYTDIGPIIENEDFIWSESEFYVVKDINLYNLDMIDHWLALNRANSLAEVKQSYKDFNGLVFNNTLLTGREDVGVFMGDKAVPALSFEAIQLLKNDEMWSAARKEYGVTILPGHLSSMIFTAALGYDQTPQLVKSSYVQNANDSHWATNPKHLLEGFSPLLGNERSPLSFRTRMGLQLIEDAAGDDKKFSLMELEQALLSDRSYLAELILKDVVALCDETPNKLINMMNKVKVDITQACQLLSEWNGEFNADSRGAIVFRELAFLIDQQEHFSVPFDMAYPATTPRQLKQNEEIITLLARAVINVNNVGLDLDTPVNKFQFIESTAPDGKPAGNRMSWPGVFEEEGGFNMIATSDWDKTLFPKHHYPVGNDVVSGEELESQLTDQGYHVRFGSSWSMLVEFNQQGPNARGLLTYSQSSDLDSPHFADQSLFYSRYKQLLPLPYRSEEIKQSTISELIIQH
ncbi:putative Aculeacin A acylase precursor [Contains: Aculeacin A small subunit; Aculeacin A large subunit] [Xenorhabdus nematophila AN6/1]|nr:putative Aculeacin A acylase precursor [Contains: Aculeacin A small subunit; Aculeacin A large subunit] [Xenorhabdus nematophila AN6/1]